MGGLEAWLSLQVGGPILSPSHLRDGVMVAKALANIHPHRFHNLRRKMRVGASRSCVFMLGNLRRILVSLRSYYLQVLGVLLPSARQPCLIRIARDGDLVEIDKMLRLVLGCALTCRNREKYIEQILSMEPEGKTQVLVSVRSLELEMGLLHLRIYSHNIREEEISEQSEDSGIFMPSPTSSTTRRSKSGDFSCQHDSLLEASLEESDPAWTSWQIVQQLTRHKQHADSAFHTLPDRSNSSSQTNEQGCQTTQPSGLLEQGCQTTRPSGLLEQGCQTEETRCHSTNQSVTFDANSSGIYWRTSEIVDVDGNGSEDAASDTGAEVVEHRGAAAQEQDRGGELKRTEEKTTFGEKEELVAKIHCLEQLLLDQVSKDAIISKLEKQIQQLEQEALLSLTRLERAASDLADARASTELQEAELASIRENLRQKEDSAQATKDKIVSLSSSLLQADDRSLVAEAEVTSLRRSLQEIEGRYNLAKAEMASLQTGIEQAEEMSFLLEAELARMKESLRKADEKLLLAEADVASLRTDQELAEDRAKSSDAEVASLRASLKQAENRALLTKAELDMLRNELKHAEDRAAELEHRQDLGRMVEENSVDEENAALRRRVQYLEELLRRRLDEDEVSRPGLIISHGKNRGLEAIYHLFYRPPEHERHRALTGSDCGSSGLGFSLGSSTATATEHRAQQLSPLGLIGKEESCWAREAARLTELVEVMEEREQQLLEELDRRDSHSNKEGKVDSSSRSAEYSRRMKNVLLLTAAFGAVHQAVQAENMLECLPM